LAFQLWLSDEKIGMQMAAEIVKALLEIVHVEV
jgi:hypothetical protein